MTVRFRVAMTAIALTAALCAAEPVLDFDTLREAPTGAPVTLAGLSIAGEPAHIELERFSVLAPDARVVVAGRGGEAEVDMGSVVLLRGWVLSDPDSTVVVAVTPWWTQGFVETVDGLYFLSTGPGGADGPGPLQVTAAADLPPDQALPVCGVAPDAEHGAAVPADQARGSGPPPCRTARVAIDTDYQYTLRCGGDPLQAAAYALLLTAASSEIYQRDLNVHLVLAYARVWADDSDPYPDIGDALQQVDVHWNMYMGAVAREFTLLLTGRANLPYGGVARLSGLCRPNNGFGVIANVRGSFPYPLVDQHAGNRDIVTFAHEIGHIFGTLHTHDGYSPPLDTCGLGDCSNGTVSTIMSYCQLCPGAWTNIQLRFHPSVIDKILYHLDAIAPCDLRSGEPLALDDVFTVFSDRPRPLDPLANDIATACHDATPPEIATVQAVSAAGGTVELMSPQPPYPHTFLRYTASPDFDGPDTIVYTLNNGSSATITLNVRRLRPSVFPGPVVQGVRASYYQVPAPVMIPDLDALEPFFSEIVPAVDFVPGAPTFAGSGLAANVAARFEGYFVAAEEGNHVLGVYSDDGARLSLHGETIFERDQVQDYNGGFVNTFLHPGAHPVRIDFFQHDGPAALTAWWFFNAAPGSSQPFGSPEIIPASRWLTADPCPADFDASGTVDFFDIGFFISAFADQDPRTDYRPDGILNFFDVAEFISLFQVGCP